MINIQCAEYEVGHGNGYAAAGAKHAAGHQKWTPEQLDDFLRGAAPHHNDSDPDLPSSSAARQAYVAGYHAGWDQFVSEVGGEDPRQ